MALAEVCGLNLPSRSPGIGATAYHPNSDYLKAVVDDSETFEIPQNFNVSVIDCTSVAIDDKAPYYRSP